MKGPTIAVKPCSVRRDHSSDLADTMLHASPATEAQRLAENSADELRKSSQEERHVAREGVTYTSPQT